MRHKVASPDQEAVAGKSTWFPAINAVKAAGLTTFPRETSSTLSRCLKAAHYGTRVFSHDVPGRGGSSAPRRTVRSGDVSFGRLAQGERAKTKARIVLASVGYGIAVLLLLLGLFAGVGAETQRYQIHGALICACELHGSAAVVLLEAAAMTRSSAIIPTATPSPPTVPEAAFRAKVH